MTRRRREKEQTLDWVSGRVSGIFPMMGSVTEREARGLGEGGKRLLRGEAVDADQTHSPQQTQRGSELPPMLLRASLANFS